MTAPSIPTHALHTAADWLVRQEAAPLNEGDRQAFAQWLRQDPAHQTAWERVNTALAAPLATVRTLQPQAEGLHVQAAMQALFQTRRRRVLRGALAMGGIGVTSAFVADRLTPLGHAMADLRTGTGERRSFTLADGTTVLLDARSAVDVHAIAGTTVLQHRTGALIATCAANGSSPLQVHSRDGQVQLDAGRMMARILADRTEVVAMDGPLTLLPREHAPSVLRTGEGARFSARGTEPLHGNALGRTAWQQGMLAVDDWPLAEVAQALQAYFPGFIRVSPSVAGLRVFGIFQLDVPQLLQTLTEILPVHIHRLGPLISIDHPHTR